MAVVQQLIGVHQGVNVPDQTNRLLLEIIRGNFATKYASQAPSLAEFRSTLSLHNGTDTDDASLLSLFRAHVPLSDYESYKPFIERFNARPCREEDVKDLLAPGLPDFFALSSGAIGATPKMIPKYNYNARPKIRLPAALDPHGKDLIALVAYMGNSDVKEIESVSGRVVQRIPVSIMSSGRMRRVLGWYTDDENWMNLSVPGHAAPLAATLIENPSSLLIVHGLFFLTRREVKRFHTTFASVFVDLICYIDQQWEVLVSSIRDGTVPDLEGISYVRKYLQAQLHADPERAAELRRIGSPFSCEGWVHYIWPQASVLTTTCSGPFSTMLPKVRSILGPSILIECHGYFSSEATIGFALANKLDEFVLMCEEVIEFLDISKTESHENIRQAWEVEVGKKYEPVVTTGSGLWRYKMGDIVRIVGFDARNKSPVFKYLGRKSLTMHLPLGRITDYQILEAMQSIQSENTIRVQEFTTVIDDRTLPATSGILIEHMGPLGRGARKAPQILFDALAAATNIDEHRRALENGEIRLPTIRIVRAGTFAAYRRSSGKRVGFVQSKVPLMLLDPTMREWFLDKVVEEI